MPTLKQRQREVEQCLALFRLRRGPYLLSRRSPVAEENEIRRLRAALNLLGPVFSLFGLYLSTRTDLFGPSDCQELAQISLSGEESSPEAIDHLIRQEFGCSAEDAYVSFETKPFASDLLYQQHHAWLTEQEPVTVKIVHPEVEEFFQSDVQLLQLLRAALTRDALDDFEFESAVDDFRCLLQQKTDLSAQAAAFATVATDTDLFGMLRVPLVYTKFTTSRVLTTERLPGHCLDLLLTTAQNEGEFTAHANGDGRYALSRRLCVVWLRQTLLGSLFPADPLPANISVLPNQRITFTDGCFAALTAEVKANLWEYLMAVATENPDLACSRLLKELEQEEASLSPAELQQKFRQGVPFRDADWADGGERNSLADHVFLQWKLATEGGYRPRPYLLPFFRSLFMIAGIAQRLAPGRDALLDALQDVRVLAGMERFREMLSMRGAGEQMEKYFGVMIDLPKRLDEMLTLIADDNARFRLNVPERSEPAHKKSMLTAIATMLVLMAVMILLVQKLNGDPSDAWSQGIKAGVLVLGAVTLLRAARGA